MSQVVSALSLGSRVLETHVHCWDLSLIRTQVRMNGDVALAALRTAGCAIPVAAVTANATHEDEERYLAQGFAGLLPKPFTQAQMRTLLESVMPRE